MKEIIDKFDKLSKELNNQLTAKNLLVEQEKDYQKELKELKDKESDNLIKKELLEQASDKARGDGMQVLSDTASNAVQSILGEGTFVDMESSIRNGVPNVDVVVKREKDGTELITNPTEGEGGGVADIVSLAMFFSIGLLVGQDNEAPLFLDEPTKFLSKGYSNDAATFVKDMVQYTNKQTFMVTHDERIANSADKVFKVELNDSLNSEVTELSS